MVLAARTLVFALPLAILLFIFFPRLPGAFWAIPRSEAALTGLSDTMTPGSISQLTNSYDVASERTSRARRRRRKSATGAARCSTNSTVTPGSVSPEASFAWTRFSISA